MEPFFGGEERTESEIRFKRDPMGRYFGFGLSETLLDVAGCDPIQDWQKRYYYEWLRKSGKDVEIIEYQNMIHEFQVFPILPEAFQFLSYFNHLIIKQVAGS
ncbi:hypothetical protein V8G54_012098 [Vigna mungo]|uniref:Alpha/beta hydrolase fold-3 domain-containing protein n=1 Tax=Vigna mungo TaxID=3915 RepID=A0AAQ3NSV3_VIGMU